LVICQTLNSYRNQAAHNSCPINRHFRGEIVYNIKVGLGEPEWAKWQSELPDAVYGFKMFRSGFKTPLQARDSFHSDFSRYVSGENATREYRSAFSAVENALADFGVVEVCSELPVAGHGLSGQIDLVGCDDTDRPVLAELKTTLGPYALKPRPSEVIQLGTYAFLQGSINPKLMWIRVGLRSSVVSVFVMPDTKNLINSISNCIPGRIAA